MAALIDCLMLSFHGSGDPAFLSTTKIHMLSALADEKQRVHTGWGFFHREFCKVVHLTTMTDKALQEEKDEFKNKASYGMHDCVPPALSKFIYWSPNPGCYGIKKVGAFGR